MIDILIYCDENMVIRRLLANFPKKSTVKIMHFPLLAILKISSLSSYLIVLDFFFSSFVAAITVVTNVLLSLMNFLYLRLNVFYYFQKALTYCFLKYSSTTFSFLLQFQLHMQYFTRNHFSLWNLYPVWGFVFVVVFCVFVLFQ